MLLLEYEQQMVRREQEKKKKGVLIDNTPNHAAEAERERKAHFLAACLITCLCY